jgi:D-serine deaminase-like pyridoxal phosphate-dependent protein
MKIHELTTPSFLVDLDVLEANIHDMARLCKENHKALWPMTKTHKSSAIAKMQYEAGVGGFLTGTIDEAQRFIEKGYKNIMLAYPVASKENLQRIAALRKESNLIVALDGEAAAKALEDVLEEENLDINYLVIVDCGLHRFGVKPEKAVELAENLKKYRCLKFKGISTHPGHVYSSTNMKEVEKVAREERDALKRAKEALEEKEFKVEIVATGSTPTANPAAKSDVITALRPGNYVFYDNIQRSMGVVTEDRCALTVLATVISHPMEDVFMVDAGSKCLGLDKGAHGIALMRGFGYIKGHPELIITDLSEEVAKIKVEGDTDIKVGDKIRIIPNHSCSCANMTDYLIGHRNEKVEEIIYIDVRGGSFRRPPVE